jgi:NAD(P)-dependent dehydrogenase (short-subunit alcohol dehydrogenase family)
VQQQRGSLDIVFANAGGGEFAPLGAITKAHVDQTFNAHVKRLLFTVQKALPLLVDGSSIILNASTAASTGTPAFSVYSATKAAVRSFARSWTLDLKHRHMGVNALSPRGTDTAGLHGLAQTEAHAQELNALVSTIPLGRMATAD